MLHVQPLIHACPSDEYLLCSPTPIQQCKKQHRMEKAVEGSHDRGNHPNGGGGFPAVPPCACGSKRIFEVELLPSILFVLDVDAYAQAMQGNNGGRMAASVALNEVEKKMNDKFDNGGMDWGALAIYSCPESCDMNREEYVVVQKSVDGTPEMREFRMIQDDSSSKANEEQESDHE